VVTNLVQFESASRSTTTPASGSLNPEGQVFSLFSSFLEKAGGTSDVASHKGGSTSVLPGAKLTNLSAGDRPWLAKAQRSNSSRFGSDTRSGEGLPVPIVANASAHSIPAIEVISTNSGIRPSTSSEATALRAVSDGPSVISGPASVDPSQTGASSASAAPAPLVTVVNPLVDGLAVPTAITKDCSIAVPAESQINVAECQSSLAPIVVANTDGNASARPEGLVHAADLTTTPAGPNSILDTESANPELSARVLATDPLMSGADRQNTEIRTRVTISTTGKPHLQFGSATAKLPGVASELRSAGPKLADTLPPVDGKPVAPKAQDKLPTNSLAGVRIIASDDDSADPGYSEGDSRNATTPRTSPASTAETPISSIPTIAVPDFSAEPKEIRSLGSPSLPDGSTVSPLSTSAGSVVEGTPAQALASGTEARPAQPAGDSVPMPGDATSPVQTARLVNGSLQSEMHIDLRTQAFGSVEVHTLVRDNQLGLAVCSERGNLHGFLNSEVPVLQTTFRQQELRLETIRFMDSGADVGSFLSGGGGQPSQRFRQGNATGDESPSAEQGLEVVAEDKLDSLGNTKLSVLA
jgi:hypothetical protein